MQEAAQHVSAELVGAERMRGARTGQTVDRIRRLGRDGPEQRTHDREDRNGSEHDESGEPEPAHARRSRGSIRV